MPMWNQVETELEVNEKGEYTAPAGYIRAMAKLVMEQRTQKNPGNILLLGVGGGSFFQELQHQRCAGCKVPSFIRFAESIFLYFKRPDGFVRTCSFGDLLGLNSRS